MLVHPIPADLGGHLRRFAQCVEPLGVTVEHVADSAAAVAFFVKQAAAVEAKRAIVSSELVTAAPKLADALLAADFAWASPAAVADARDQPFGVSFATLAVAETGSVMLAEHTLEDRAVGLLTRTHVTVVRTAGLVPSLAEAALALKNVALRPGGGYASLVTGPSRTGDIEMSLTIGVQGPARVLTLFVDDLS